MKTLRGKTLFITGASRNFCIDEDVLRSGGVSDFSAYSDCAPEELIPDSFI